jgi:hypothetical protein
MYFLEFIDNKKLEECDDADDDVYTSNYYLCNFKKIIDNK